MSVENFNEIELNLDLSYINCSTTALIREYLARKGLRKTLERFDEENSENFSENINSRTKLIEYLNIQSIYEKNKSLKTSFKTILELLISYHSAKFSHKKNKQLNIEMGSKKSFMDKSDLRKKINDLKIDDANEGELTDGNDKRIDSKKTNDKDKESGVHKISKTSKASTNDNSRSRNLDIEKKICHQNKSSETEDDDKREAFNFQKFLAKPDLNNKSRSDDNLKELNSTSEYRIKPIDFETAKNLRELIFGSLNQTFNDEWKIQNLKFCDYAKMRFGLVQKKGGPCGVLAAIQSYVLLELVFGNNNETSNDLNLIFNPNKANRLKSLAKALAKILWKCGNNSQAVIASPTSKAHFPPSGKYRTDGFTETINLLYFDDYEKLKDYLSKNVELYEHERNYGCIMVLYSAIFSRTFEQIKEDMDDVNNKLMGKHGYCSMEMVNLLIHGRAVSNVFNDMAMVDHLELRGPNKRNDVGLLSLFEHYKSCEVGSYYKTPKYPIWVVCSESHFSVLFALSKDILNDWKAETKFDLYYYDGLAGQNEQIRLTISSKSYQPTKPSFFDEILQNKKNDKKELVPPLELVIRTKWKNAYVDWNSTDPIL